MHLHPYLHSHTCWCSYSCLHVDSHSYLRSLVVSRFHWVQCEMASEIAVLLADVFAGDSDVVEVVGLVAVLIVVVPVVVGAVASADVVAAGSCVCMAVAAVELGLAGSGTFEWTLLGNH